MKNIVISLKGFKVQRLSSYCTKRGDNTVNLVTSRKIIARLARPIASAHTSYFIRPSIVGRSVHTA